MVDLSHLIAKGTIQISQLMIPMTQQHKVPTNSMMEVDMKFEEVDIVD